MTWRPGQSGTPGGRVPEDRRRVREMARQHTELAINTLAEICGDVEARSAARVTAASALLDRGWGRPDAHDALIDATDDALRAEVRRRMELERARPRVTADPNGSDETH